MKIDATDKKIFSILDRNARLSEAAIAKEIGVSKQVVNYRLKRLEKEGVIENYYTMLDVGKLGCDTYYLYLQLSGISKKEEQLLLSKMKTLPYVAWLIVGVGRWDVVLLVCASSISQFEQALAEIQTMCGTHLHEHEYSVLLQAEHISYKFFRGNFEHSLKTTPRAMRRILDDKERAILSVLDQNGRISVTDLAQKTGLPLHVVHYHLKELIKEKLIQGFRPKLNVGKLGYQWHLLLLQLQNVPVERKAHFLEYCRQSKQVYYVTNTVGRYSVMLDVQVTSTAEFRDFLLSLKEEYPDVIKLYESIIIFEELVLTYAPKTALEQSYI